MKVYDKRVAGLTVIEVLVVLVIIAVLAALLFPVLTSAKRAAKSVSCISNLKQFGTATQMYRTDHDGLLPVENPRSLVAAHDGSVSDPLQAYGMIQELYQCPDYRQRSRVADGGTDYTIRFNITFHEGDHVMKQVRVLHEESGVIAYCRWNSDNPEKPLGTGDGLVNALRLNGAVERIASGKLINHSEDWGNFGPDVDAPHYRWIEFPGESFPPALAPLE